MPEEAAQEAQPTAEEMQKMAVVGQAGAEAAAQAETPEDAKPAARAAMRERADAEGLKLSDEELDQVADKMVDKLAAIFEQRGAFDPPPEPVEPPPTAPPAPSGETPAPTELETPRKRSFAEKFFGE